MFPAFRWQSGVIRIMAERRAKKYLADIILMNPHAICDAWSHLATA